jgi:high-affinity K+ transport system ATPase subunit B
MPRAKNLKSQEHDPALVELFQGSRKSYDTNVDDLIQKLDEAAIRTRAERANRKAGPDITVVTSDAGVLTIQVKSPIEGLKNPKFIQAITKAIKDVSREKVDNPVSSRIEKTKVTS